MSNQFSITNGSSLEAMSMACAGAFGGIEERASVMSAPSYSTVSGGTVSFNGANQPTVGTTNVAVNSMKQSFNPLGLGTNAVQIGFFPTLANKPAAAPAPAM